VTLVIERLPRKKAEKKNFTKKLHNLKSDREKFLILLIMKVAFVGFVLFLFSESSLFFVYLSVPYKNMY